LNDASPHLEARFEAVDYSQLWKEIGDARRQVHLVLQQGDFDYSRMQYNTVVSACMKLLNVIESPAMQIATARHPVMGSDEITPPLNLGMRVRTQVTFEALGILLRLLYPVCPHITHQLWEDLGYAVAYGDLLDAPWPLVDASALVQDEIELMLQVSGKLRGSIVVPTGASKEEIEAVAISSQIVHKFAAGAAIKKVIVVPGRLVNVVV
jgi:leucyl-tRNA synthetase